MAYNPFIIIFLLFLISLLLGWIFNKFKILKVSYFLSSEEPSRSDAMDKNSLNDFKERYGKYLSLLTPFSISWGLSGILLTIMTSYREDFFDGSGQTIMLDALFGWIFLSAVFLGLVPILILIKTIKLPSSLQEINESRFAVILLVVVLIGIVSASLVLDLSPFGIVLLGLLSMPALVSAWLAGEFYAVFAIRQYYKMLGWDYIEGKRAEAGIKGVITRGTGCLGFLLTIIAPILAINSLISIFSKEEVREQGGPLGSATETVLPEIIQIILVFILLLGPLISVATQPAGFLELSINSEIYNTLSKFDWEEFNRKSAKVKEIINLKPYPIRVMAGILILFLSFIMYVALLSIGGIINGSDIPVRAGFDQLAESLKFIEVPVLLLVIFTILRDLS
ncbi:MAG: hypothetical protein ACXAD7_10375, partial [Candidatus Kariarchaeaceae archaeon]